MTKNKSALGFLLSLASGILMVFAFPPFDLWYLAFFALIPLLLSTREHSAINFFFGTVSGFVFYALSFAWLYGLAGIFYLLLALYLSFFWGIFLYVVFSLPRAGRIFTGAAVWFFLEIIISNLMTGFPWLLMGLSQWQNPHLVNIAGIAGIYGLSFLVVAVNLAVFYVFGRRHLFSFFTCLALVSGAVSIPCKAILPHTREITGSLKIMAVQPNIDASSEKDPEDVLRTLEILTEKKLAERRPAIVIWPESSFPCNIYARPEIIKRLCEMSLKHDFTLVLGTFTPAENGFYNSALAISGKEITAYNKIKLAPYGEFIPGGRYAAVRTIFEKQAGYIPQVSHGSELTMFMVKGHDIAPLICFENIFPHLTAAFTHAGAELFVVITNDSWFGKSAGPYQHFAHNSIRAAESGRYFVQAALSGISGIVSPCGEVTEMVVAKDGSGPLFVEGVIYGDVPLVSGKTFYSSYGDAPLFLVALLITGAAICRNRQKNSKKK